MKRNTILIILVLGILILGACSKTDSQTSTDSNDKFSGKLADIMNSGSSYKCTTMQENNQIEMYVKGKKVRSELTTPQGKVNVVSDENKCVWMWQNGTNQGTKFCSDETKSDSDTTEEYNAQVQGKTDPNTNVDCNKFSVSDDMFTPPTNVQFSDLSEMMKKFQNPQQEQ
ncbi:MAG: hypothetical protein AABX19_01490 [Nanoarchaeota archaeon]